jgi:hypothetical protein
MAALKQIRPRELVLVGFLIVAATVAWLPVVDAVLMRRDYALRDDMRRSLHLGEVMKAWKVLDGQEIICGLWVIDGVMDAIDVGALPSLHVNEEETAKLIRAALAIGGKVGLKTYAHRYTEASAESKSWLPLP